MNKPRSLRILFAGTPEVAAVPLRAMLADGFTPIAALTQPDRRAGRGRELQASPVKQAAIAAGIPVHQPESLRDGDAAETLATLAPDLMIVVAYGQILPANLLEIPAQGCWNIHASLLPRWRGAAPIQRAIEAGDRETGVCIMQMDAGLDTGPVLHRARMPLDGTDTGGSLHDRLAQLGARSLLECLRRLAAEARLEAVPQARTGVSYARKLDKDEAQIDWSAPAELLERRVRAFNPWPVAWCTIGEERVRVWRAEHLRQTHDRPPGAVLASDGGIDVATGCSVLRLLELQPPGKRRMSAAEFLRARCLPENLSGRPGGAS
jgi:methionyl-tRNA formyltransferase